MIISEAAHAKCSAKNGGTEDEMNSETKYSLPKIRNAVLALIRNS